MILYLLAQVPEEKPGSFELEGCHWALELHDLEVDGAEEPLFTCISYSWGGGREPSPLRANFDISDRTLPALATVTAHRPSCNRVWIDALSVPEEVQERARTLASMGKIYSLAKETFVVLSSGAQTALRQMAESNRIEHECLYALEKEPWVSRAWTYQEAVNSKEMYITCEGPHGALVPGNLFMNRLGYTLNRLEGSDIEKEREFPRLSAFEGLITDYMLANYEERSALQVMSKMDKRISSRPEDHFYAMMGAISTTTADMSSITEPCEAFMALCEDKGDYSFIYSAARRDPALQRRWRPVAGNLPSILPYATEGSGQPGHKEGDAFYLDFMIVLQRSPIEEEAERFVRAWLLCNQIVNIQPQSPLHHLAYTVLQSWGFIGGADCVFTARGYFFPLEPIKADHVTILVATKVRWRHGAPGFACCDELNGRVYIPGVFVGHIDGKDSTSVRML
ncbi:hypothetical protein AOQ84DRAFT_416187 [Glonium stellatum]|uniref:Heterokaryon incompatibility domain-containing protein n=1 Tax=Glonium stellatum TaxID=574774 RepID=A0A8E2EUA1_9PEZI|nr:hypothetical protein AOQ84DRAFT_416187 [Glonium stellatum]